jgi:hypothetical protein
LVVGSINAAATSSTYRVKFNVLIALFGNSNSDGVGYWPALIRFTKAVHFFKSDLRFFLDCSNVLRDVCSGDSIVVVVVVEDGSV